MVFLFVGSYVIKLSSVIKKRNGNCHNNREKKVCAIINNGQQIDERISKERREKKSL